MIEKKWNTLIHSYLQLPLLNSSASMLSKLGKKKKRSFSITDGKKAIKKDGHICAKLKTSVGSRVFSFTKTLLEWIKQHK